MVVPAKRVNSVHELARWHGDEGGPEGVGGGRSLQLNLDCIIAIVLRTFTGLMFILALVNVGGRDGGGELPSSELVGGLEGDLDWPELMLLRMAQLLAP